MRQINGYVAFICANQRPIFAFISVLFLKKVFEGELHLLCQVSCE